MEAASRRAQRTRPCFIPTRVIDFQSAATGFTRIATWTLRSSEIIRISAMRADFRRPTNTIFRMATGCFPPSISMPSATWCRMNSCSSRPASGRTPRRRKPPARSITRTLISPDVLLTWREACATRPRCFPRMPQSTPIIVSQDRGYREGYLRADLAGHHGRHEWKIGVDGIFNPVHETLQYQITDPTQFDPGTVFAPPLFSDRRWDVEPSAYAEDQIRLGKWNVSAGLRFDHYEFAVNESAWSPRIGVSRFISSLHLLLHGSYDRVFQTPAMENLLLASSPKADSFSGIVVQLPVQPARANYYRGGFHEIFCRQTAHRWKCVSPRFSELSPTMTCCSIPASVFLSLFRRRKFTARKFKLPCRAGGAFRDFSAIRIRSGTGQGPITGGLFLGSMRSRIFPIRASFPFLRTSEIPCAPVCVFRPPSACGSPPPPNIGSGLPVDLDGSHRLQRRVLAQYGAAILNQVNFAAGRVRPEFLARCRRRRHALPQGKKDVSFQIEGNNLTDHLNVINFASLFSGTAIAAPRSVSARLKLAF